MSASGLFVIGVIITLIVAAALALLIYAEILDGRYAAQKKIADPELAPDGPRRSKAANASRDSGAATRKDIVETAREAGKFTTLLTAIDRAGLRATLAGEGPFTIFAPSDEAFAQLPEGAVQTLLGEPSKLRTAPTVHGEDLPLSVDGCIRVDWAQVLSADIEASNGLIHVIDRVLLPAAM